MGEPLEAIDRLVPWESFRVNIEAVVLTPAEIKRRRRHEAGGCLGDSSHGGAASAGQFIGRADRISGSRPIFVHALSASSHRGQHPDATTLWLCREKLAKASLIEKLFERFDKYLVARG